MAHLLPPTALIADTSARGIVGALLGRARRALARARGGGLPPARRRLLGRRGPADVGRRARARDLGVYRLVRRLGFAGADDLGDRLAHRRSRETRLLHRADPAGTRDPARGGLRAAGERA